MLIKSLYEYYDNVLIPDEKVLSKTLSRVKISYMISLNTDGSIGNIIKWQTEEKTVDKKGNVKIKYLPKNEVFPKRTEKPGIDANIVEHRPLYIFGLNFDKKEEIFTTEDKTNKARKSHEDFKRKTLEFLNDIEDPDVEIYRRFINHWVPEEQTENEFLKCISKDYATVGFSFCIAGHPDQPIHKNQKILEKWNSIFEKSISDQQVSQCAITGKVQPVARIHGKVKGLVKPGTGGNVLVNFNNASEQSYGKEQSYNSNISEEVAYKYVEALNYLLTSKINHIFIDELSIVYWSVNSHCDNDMLMDLMLNPDVNDIDMNIVLNTIMKNLKSGKLIQENLDFNIDPDTDFFIVGMKTNSSRISVKFQYHNKYGAILRNMAQHQMDLKVDENAKPIPMWIIKKNLTSSKSTNAVISPALTDKIMSAAIFGNAYPVEMLSTTLRLLMHEKNISGTRIGLIKGFINRKNRLKGEKEEIGMALDEFNKNKAYLCGRLFAVLEKVQEEAAGAKLNKTIKEAYFASAAGTPAPVLAKLLKKAQYHIKKLDNEGRRVFFNKTISSIMGGFDETIPARLNLEDQGRFMIGYYHQREALFNKKVVKEEEN